MWILSSILFFIPIFLFFFKGNYWLRLYDAKKATRVKLSGLTYEGTEEFDLQKIRQEEIAKGEKLIVEDGDLKL